jgi:hypothetical protein
MAGEDCGRDQTVIRRSVAQSGWNGDQDVSTVGFGGVV